MAGDDGVEEDEDAEGQPEEQADDREEEGLRPGGVHVGGAAGVGGVVLVVCDGEDGRGEEDGEEPGDETDQPGLVLGPDKAGSQWQTHGVVPSILGYWNIIVSGIILEYYWNIIINFHFARNIIFHF